MSNDWVMVEKFPHSEGMHCESTTLRDHVNFLGYPYSEAMMFGLDATLGFAYWGINPSFPLGGKGSGFHKNSLACRVLGIEVQFNTFRNREVAWKDAIRQIDNNHPLILQGDMGYLPFFDNPNEEDFHFGGHIFSIIGYNLDKQLALLCDNNFKAPQEIALEDLMKARNSHEGPKFLWPHNARYVLNKRSDDKRPPLSAGVKLAIQTAARNMMGASTNNNGIGGLKKFVEAIGNWKSHFSDNILESQLFLQMLYGYIEEYGTGGSIFRKLYLNFLNEVITQPELSAGKRPWSKHDFKIITDNLEFLKTSVDKWHEFAKIIKTTMQTHPTDGINKIPYSTLQDIGNEIIYSEQKLWKNLLSLKV